MSNDNDLIRRGEAMQAASPRFVTDEGGGPDRVASIPPARLTVEDVLEQAVPGGVWHQRRHGRYEAWDRGYGGRLLGTVRRCQTSYASWTARLIRDGMPGHIVLTHGHPTLAEAQAACDAAALEHLPVSALLPRRREP